MSEGDFALLQPSLNPAVLNLGDILIEQQGSLTEVFFVESGLVSVVSPDEADQSVELGIYGFEGMGSTASVMTIDRCPHQHIVQVEGRALRLDSGRLKRAQQSSESLNSLMLKFAHIFGIQMASTAVANGAYSVAQRLARWLLMCQDRNDHTAVYMTHHFLSTMLATSRPSVTEAINNLESLGLVKSVRGKITILDRKKLKEEAGRSYGRPEEEYRRLIGPPNIFENSNSHWSREIAQ